MKKTAILTASHKGGVGKSTFCRGLLDHLRRFALPAGGSVVALDGQPSVGHLANFYGIKVDGKYDPGANELDIARGVRAFDPRGKGVRELGNVLDIAPDIILADMPGGGVDDAGRVFGGMREFAAAYAEEGYEILLAIGVNHLKASAESIHDIVETWGTDGVRYAAVLNLGVASHAPGDNEYLFFDGARAAEARFPAKVLQAAGGVVFEMPAIEADTYALVDAAQMGFSEFAAARETVERTDRTRIASFVQKFDQEVHAKLGLLSDDEYGPEALAEFEGTRRRLVLGSK